MERKLYMTYNENEQKEIIMDFLQSAYTKARMMYSNEMMCRISRAILAFSYDDLENMPTWEEMQEAYMNT